jgi:hypothetical protein
MLRGLESDCGSGVLVTSTGLTNFISWWALCSVFPIICWLLILSGHISNALSMICYMSFQILLLLLPLGLPSLIFRIKPEFAVVELKWLVMPLKDQSSS